MVLTFHKGDGDFERNLRDVRLVMVQKRPFAPDFLVVCIDGVARDARYAQIRADGWFAYSDDMGEQRVELDRVSWVSAYFTE